jgi:hypothetical protein
MATNHYESLQIIMIHHYESRRIIIIHHLAASPGGKRKTETEITAEDKPMTASNRLELHGAPMEWWLSKVLLPELISYLYANGLFCMCETHVQSKTSAVGSPLAAYS